MQQRSSRQLQTVALLAGIGGLAWIARISAYRWEPLAETDELLNGRATGDVSEGRARITSDADEYLVTDDEHYGVTSGEPFVVIVRRGKWTGRRHLVSAKPKRVHDLDVAMDGFKATLRETDEFLKKAAARGCSTDANCDGGRACQDRRCCGRPGATCMEDYDCCSLHCNRGLFICVEGSSARTH